MARRPKCDPIKPEQLRFLQDKTADYLKERPELAPLVERLLAIGGEMVCLCFEEDLEKLLGERGQKWPASTARLRRGAPSRCHQNAANLWNANREHVSIVTGWALSRDGIWRQHTWCWQTPVRGRTGRVVETTEKRVAYFGYELGAREAEEFYVNNAL
jgi:hypothetical protein